MYVYKYNLIYLLCMINARIRWCTCRVENILTLGKLLSLWFCFLLHSILSLISQTSYRTYKIISSYELARPRNGNHFSRYKLGYVKRGSTAFKVPKDGCGVPSAARALLGPEGLLMR